MYQRFQAASVPPILSNAHILSFAVNEYTRELLYVSTTHIALVSLVSLAELRTVPFSSLIRTENLRAGDRKFQEVLQQYQSYGLNFLNSLPNLNIWLGVINRRRVVCLSEELEVSNEVTLDSSGVVSLFVHPSTGDLFILGLEGKMFVFSVEYSFDAVRKRLATLYDFEIKISGKKQITIEVPLSKAALSVGAATFILAVADSSAPQVEIHIWNYTAGDKTYSILHSDSSGQHTTIQALTASHSTVAVLDSNRTLAIYDFLTRQELVRQCVGSSMGEVESLVLEDPDVTCGVYLLEATGRIGDFVPGSGILSTFTSTRPTKERTPRLPKSPAQVTIVTQYSGLKQLWLLVDGALDVVNLASIGHVTDLGRVSRAEVRFEQLFLYSEEGDVGVYDPRRERIVQRYEAICKGFTDKESPEGRFCPAFSAYLPDINFLAYISTNGLLKLYDLDSGIASINTFIPKKAYTAACFLPYPNSLTSFDCLLGTSLGEVLIFTYDKLTREVTLRRKFAPHSYVVGITKQPRTQRVMTVGREGVVRLLAWPEYRWEASTLKGFWTDCSACAICGNSLLVLGYESGMLQTIYLSFGSVQSAASLLEYHLVRVTSICGLPNSNSEAISADSTGLLVLWNLDQSSPIKVFSVLQEVTTVALFGGLKSEKAFIVLKSACLFLSLRTKAQFMSVSMKELAKWKEEKVKKRTEYKGRKVLRRADMRSSSLASLEEIIKKGNPQPLGFVTKLLKKVTAAKAIVERDVLSISPEKRLTEAPQRLEIKKMTDSWYRTYRNRPLTRILEQNGLERLKKSVSKVITHFGEEIPNELAFNGQGLRKFSPSLNTDRGAIVKKSRQSARSSQPLTERKHSSRPSTSQTNSHRNSPFHLAPRG